MVPESDPKVAFETPGLLGGPRAHRKVPAREGLPEADPLARAPSELFHSFAGHSSGPDVEQENLLGNPSLSGVSLWAVGQQQPFLGLHGDGSATGSLCFDA